MLETLFPDQFFQQFHFLRPWWGLLFIVLGYLIWKNSQSQDKRDKQNKAFAPHIYDQLVANKEANKTFSPKFMAWVLLATIIVVMMGPSWQRQPSPFLEDASVLFVVLDASESMATEDIQPSRIERAKHKIEDLLNQRDSGYTSLIVYAGSAHTVLPLTNDKDILINYLSGVTPEIMPKQGKFADNALAIIEQVPIDDTTPATVLLISDGLTETDQKAFTAFFDKYPYQLLVYGVGLTQQEQDAQGVSYATLDERSLTALASDTGGYYQKITIDKTDVDTLVSKTKNFFVVADEKHAPWIDGGYWLIFPAMLFYLLWFRKGWSIRWTSFVFALVLLPSTPSYAQETSFIEQWVTPNQQGQWYFYTGQYGKAARAFENTHWKATSYYMNEEWELAAQYFSRLKTKEARFALGNSYAHNESYWEAEEVYLDLLEEYPNWPEVQNNLKLVRVIIEARDLMSESQQQDMEEQSESSQEAENDKFHKSKGRKEEVRGKQVEVKQYSADEILNDAALNKMWMKNVQKDPAAFLANKFQAQVNNRGSQ
ncbi:VWA domain-containing protein [Thalassotalea sp. LPB0316]|uniref:vWA domain-containing protein n=1 Tax=Thalassotalea sp. LPB0316 TaxID=2769490 RepID=UPI00186925E5|nr:VWA domain-containing protein [Thalassotalea sp. LPB0316]QOL25091.1 VWA domain-containing protein [Thalassotalea sp. LPB0316]